MQQKKGSALLDRVTTESPDLFRRMASWAKWSVYTKLDQRKDYLNFAFNLKSSRTLYDGIRNDGFQSWGVALHFLFNIYIRSAECILHMNNIYSSYSVMKKTPTAIEY